MVIGRELWYESSCVDHGMDVMIAQVVCIYLSSVIFPRNWKPKTVNGIEKKNNGQQISTCSSGLASTFMTLKISKVLSDEARR